MKLVPRSFSNLHTMTKIFIVIMAVIVIGWGSYYASTRFHHQQVNQQNAATQSAAAAQADAAAKAAAEAKVAADAKAAADAAAANTAKAVTPDPTIKIVHKKEGLEHPIIRQLMADPDLLVDSKIVGVKPFTGDRDDKVALKKWAGIEADILACHAGFIGPKFHEEIRVKAPETVAVSLEKDVDGGLKVVEYSATQVPTPAATPGTTAATVADASSGTGTTTSNLTLTLVASQNVAPTIAEAHFIGPQDGTTVLPSPFSSYEYMYVG
jgi:hypothetical protein